MSQITTDEEADDFLDQLIERKKTMNGGQKSSPPRKTIAAKTN